MVAVAHLLMAQAQHLAAHTAQEVDQLAQQWLQTVRQHCLHPAQDTCTEVEAALRDTLNQHTIHVLPNTVQCLHFKSHLVSFALNI